MSWDVKGYRDRLGRALRERDDKILQAEDDRRKVEEAKRQADLAAARQVAELEQRVVEEILDSIPEQIRTVPVDARFLRIRLPTSVRDGIARLMGCESWQYEGFAVSVVNGNVRAAGSTDVSINRIVSGLLSSLLDLQVHLGFLLVVDTVIIDGTSHHYLAISLRSL